MIIRTLGRGASSITIKEPNGLSRVVMTSHQIPVLDMDSLRISKQRVINCSQIAGKARGKRAPIDNTEVFLSQARHFRNYQSKIEQVKPAIKKQVVRATFYKITNTKTGQSITMNLQRYNSLKLKFKTLPGYNIEIESKLLQR